MMKLLDEQDYLAEVRQRMEEGRALQVQQGTKGRWYKRNKAMEELYNVGVHQYVIDLQEFVEKYATPLRALPESTAGTATSRLGRTIAGLEELLAVFEELDMLLLESWAGQIGKIETEWIPTSSRTRPARGGVGALKNARRSGQR